MQRSTLSPNKITSHADSVPQMGVTFGVSCNFPNMPTQTLANHHPHYYTPAHPIHNVPYHYPDQNTPFSFSIPGIGAVWGNPETIQTFKKLDSLLSQVKNQNTEQRMQLENMFFRLEQQYIELQKKTKESAALDEKIREMHNANQVLSQQNHDLYKRANSTEEKNRTLAQESKVQLQKIKKYRSQNAALKSANEMTTMQLERSKIQTDQFKQAYQASEQKVEEKNRTIECLKAQLIAAQAEILTLKSTPPTQESITTTPQEEIEEAVPILFSMRNSTSPKTSFNELKEKFLNFNPENIAAQKPPLRPSI